MRAGPGVPTARPTSQHKSPYHRRNASGEKYFIPHQILLKVTIPTYFLQRSHAHHARHSSQCTGGARVHVLVHSSGRPWGSNPSPRERTSSLSAGPFLTQWTTCARPAEPGLVGSATGLDGKPLVLWTYADTARALWGPHNPYGAAPRGEFPNEHTFLREFPKENTNLPSEFIPLCFFFFFPFLSIEPLLFPTLPFNFMNKGIPPSTFHLMNFSRANYREKRINLTLYVQFETLQKLKSIFGLNHLFHH